LKAGKAFLETKDRTGQFLQIIKRFQGIKGLSDRMQRTQHQRFERILGTTCKTTSSKIDHERWRNPTVKTGVLPCFITSQIPGAEGYRWRIFEIGNNLNDSLVVKPLLSSCLDTFELLFLNTDPCF
jgi:hypothetical protein